MFVWGVPLLYGRLIVWVTVSILRDFQQKVGAVASGRSQRNGDECWLRVEGQYTSGCTTPSQVPRWLHGTPLLAAIDVEWQTLTSVDIIMSYAINLFIMPCFMIETQTGKHPTMNQTPVSPRTLCPIQAINRPTILGKLQPLSLSTPANLARRETA
ncbi:hypothetical protein LX36DRAFT_176189 [Colletotrichum falcatum]|nr:hypothetical protein LX36DRAFT_176189 [Colletotrichum falcatum]